MLCPKEKWSRMRWKFYAKVQRPEKRASSWEEGLSSLPEGEWAGAESPKRDNAENEKNDCKTKKGKRKGKFKDLFWYNLIYKKDFPFFAK